MVRCGMCGTQLPDDPNDVDEIVDSKYCETIFCSSECAAEHEDQMHPTDAARAGEDADRLR